MKRSMLPVLIVSLWLSASSQSAFAAAGYIYCSILADTGSNQFKHIIQKKIIKIDSEKDPKIFDKITEQYVAFVQEKHPDWFAGFRFRTEPAQAEFKMRAATNCKGAQSSLKFAQMDQAQLIKYWGDRYAKDANNGPVVIDDEFVYKP
jgi:hypothetical protein